MTESLDLGGSGGSSFSWGMVGETQPGLFVVGKVLALAEVQATEYDGPNKGKPAVWDNGDPKMQYRVTLQTDLAVDDRDDGKRDVYLDGARRAREDGTKSKLCAVLDAVRATTGGTALQVGGFLKLTWVSGIGHAGNPRSFEAQYQAPAFDLGAAAQAVQPVQPVQPVPVVAGDVPNPWAAAPPATTTTAPPAFATQQVQAYAQPIPVAQPGQVGPTTAADPFGTGVPISTPTAGPFAAQGQPAQQATSAAQGNMPTPEQVAAVKASGMDPAQVWPGVQLPA